ncbi:MAG: tetratricopeptide repeat protein, partial [Caldilineaceae bacterium]|nr:tetratricopeptide repeat protein [Caldilineaceae bacterium]
MLALESYQTATAYTLEIYGIPEMPVQSASTTLHIEGNYAFDEAARAATRTLALISREEPLAAVEAIGESPDLLIDLYRSTTAILEITLELNNEEWAEWLREDTEIAWPDETTVEARLLDGVLYFDLRELKAFLPDGEEAPDWAAIEVVKTLEDLAAAGTFSDLATEVASSSTGRSISGLDPMMVNLITSMRATFGQPALLEEFMTIRRRSDVDLPTNDEMTTTPEENTGAYYETEFDVLDFIFSDEFRTLLQQVFEIAATNDDTFVDPAETKQIADVFWLFAPALFRDLAVSGTTTVGLEHNYEVAGTSRFYWDLTTLLQVIQQFGGIELEEQADEIYIAFLIETTNRDFNQPVSVEPPPDAEILPLDTLGTEFSRTAIIPAAPESPHEPTTVEPSTDSSAEAVAQYDAGVALYDEGEWDAALDALNQAIVRDPNYAAAYYQRGKVQRDLGNLNAARQDFDQAIELDPTLAEAYVERGKLAGRNDAWADAIADYTAAITLDDQLGPAYFERGYAYKQRGDLEAAIADFTTLISLEPTNHFAYAQRADTQVIFGNYAAAITDATEVITLAPDYDWGYAVRGNAYYNMAEYAAAVADLSTAIDLSPNYDWAYVQRANAQVSLGNFAEGVADATQAIELSPNYDYAYATRGNAYRQLGDNEAALADFATAIELAPDYTYAYYSRGLIYQNQGEYELALAEYDQALTVDSTYIDALLNRGFVRTQLDDWDGAIADYDSALALNPSAAT